MSNRSVSPRKTDGQATRYGDPLRSGTWPPLKKGLAYNGLWQPQFIPIKGLHGNVVIIQWQLYIHSNSGRTMISITIFQNHGFLCWSQDVSPLKHRFPVAKTSVQHLLGLTCGIYDGRGFNPYSFCILLDKTPWQLTKQSHGWYNK